MGDGFRQYSCIYSICNLISSYFEDREGHREGKKLLSAKRVFPSLTTAPIDDEAKKHNENLPGMGGVFNVVNLQDI